jgi:hypothetical protein
MSQKITFNDVHAVWLETSHLSKRVRLADDALAADAASHDGMTALLIFNTPPEP